MLKDDRLATFQLHTKTSNLSSTPTIAPNNGFNRQTYNTCLNNFNQTSVGKVTNFFSLASPLLGPERLHSAVEDVGGSALKYYGTWVGGWPTLRVT